MDKPRILITGCNGLIGSIVFSDLAQTHEVYGLDRKGPFSERVFEADISSAESLRRVFRTVSPVDCILHLAGDARVSAEWLELLPANIIGTRNVYEAARTFQVRRIVFASSNQVTSSYETSVTDLELGTQRLNANWPICPDSEYGVSKAFGEALARFYWERWSLESICLRIGSVLTNDDPTKEARHRRTWLSHRDLLQLVRRSFTASVPFGIYYGVSNNSAAFWDLNDAREELGYEPFDDAGNR